MADNNLKISLVATLNTGLSIGEINTAISGIEKKINSLKLNIEINDKVLNTLNQFTDQMKRVSEAALNTGKVIEEALMPDGSKIKRTYFDGLKGEFSELVKTAQDAAKQQKASQEEVAQGWGDATKAVEKYNAAQKNTSNITTYQQGNATRQINTNANGEVTSFKDTTNFVKDAQDAQKLVDEQEKLVQSLKKVYDQGFLNDELFKDYNTSISSSKSIEEINKIQQALQNQIQTERNAIQQADMLSKAQSLLSSGKIVDTYGLQTLISDLNKVVPSADNATRELSLLQSQLKGISSQATVASESAASFGSAFQHALTPLTMTFGGFALFMQAINSFKQGISSLNDLNKSLTTISMITHQSQAEVNQLAQQYQQLGQQLGVSVTDMASMAAELTRQKLPMDEVTNRLKIITEFSKVAGLSAVDATTYITAATNSMKVSAEKASDTFALLGHSSAVNAGYIATAFQKVGGTAGALNLDFDKVASWISTEGERTKESAETIGQSVNNLRI